jgi:DNA end-binding protein Ku
MAPRANWKGYLRLSLVSCPIALYPASLLSEKVSFNRINRKTGNRLKQQNVETGAVVPLTRREHVIVLEPRGHGLLGLTLRYPYEVRDEAAYFEDIPALKLDKEMLDLATHIVNTKSGHFDPSHFEDRYENALVDLLKKKEAGERIEPAKAGPAPRVVNLMDALRASVDAEKKKAPAPSVQARRPAKKRAGQK